MSTRTLLCNESIIFDCPVDHVWSILSGFGAIKGWMPKVDHCSIKGEGIGAVRTVVCGGGPPVQERLATYDPDNHTLSYDIVDPTGLPMKGGVSRYTLTPKAGGTKTEMTWRTDAAEISEDGVKMIAPIFHDFIVVSLENLKEILARPGKPLIP